MLYCITEVGVKNNSFKMEICGYLALVKGTLSGIKT
jgi:hypothetical protein